MAATAFIASCGLNEEKCKQSDWAAIGQADGLRGASVDRIQAYAKSCGKHGISVDQSLWKSSREEGLKTYRTPQSAYNVGRNGRVLKNVCPDADMSAMKAAHEKGWRYHLVLSKINELERERAGLNSDIRSLLSNPVTPTSAARINQLRSRILQIDLRINHFRHQKQRFDHI